MSERKHIARGCITLLLMAGMLGAAGCAEEPPPRRATGAVAPDTSAAALLARADSAVAALRDKDWPALARLAHPERGVLFSPYGYVDTTAAITFTPEDVARLSLDTTTYLWGRYDGSGKPIRLPFDAYYDAFVYDTTFAQGRRGAPGERIGQGNTPGNIGEVFPDAQFVEYYLPGTEAYGGMDWRSLRLIFTPHEGTWRLAAVVHDEWTI